MPLPAPETHAQSPTEDAKQNAALDERLSRLQRRRTQLRQVLGLNEKLGAVTGAAGIYDQRNREELAEVEAQLAGAGVDVSAAPEMERRAEKEEQKKPEEKQEKKEVEREKVGEKQGEKKEATATKVSDVFAQPPATPEQRLKHLEHRRDQLKQAIALIDLVYPKTGGPAAAFNQLNREELAKLEKEIAHLGGTAPVPEASKTDAPPKDPKPEEREKQEEKVEELQVEKPKGEKEGGKEQPKSTIEDARRAGILHRIDQLEKAIALNDALYPGTAGPASVFNERNREELARLRAKLQHGQKGTTEDGKEGEEKPNGDGTTTPIGPTQSGDGTTGQESTEQESTEQESTEQPPSGPRRQLGNVRATMVNYEAKVERLANDLAEEQFEREMREQGARRGVGWIAGRFQRMWRKQARQGLIDEYRQQHLQAIRTNPRSFAAALARVEQPAAGLAGAATAAHEAARDQDLRAIVTRFDDSVAHGAVGTVEGDAARMHFLNEHERPEVQDVTDADLNRLFLDYAGNAAMTPAQFNARLTPILTRLRTTYASAGAQRGTANDLFHDNMLERAENMRAVVTHAGGMDRIDVNNFRVELSIGKAHDVHAHSELEGPTQADRFARTLTERLQRMPILRRIVTPTSVALLTYGGVNLIRNIATGKAARYAAMGVGGVLLVPVAAPTFLTGLTAGAIGAAAGGVVAAVRRSKDVKHQKSVVERRDALSQQVDATPFEQRLRANGVMHQKVDLQNLTTQFQQMLAQPAWAPADHDALLNALTDYRVRRSINEQDRIDLLRAGSTHTAELERSNATRAMHEVMVRLRRAGIDVEAELANRAPALRTAIANQLGVDARGLARIRRAEGFKSFLMATGVGTAMSALCGGISELMHRNGQMMIPAEHPKPPTGGGATTGPSGISSTTTGSGAVDVMGPTLPSHAESITKFSKHLISRDWYDNKTPEFDHTELQAAWGGRHGTGIDADGNYIINMAKMVRTAEATEFPIGTRLPSLSADKLRDLIHTGNLRYVIIPDEAHRLNPIVIEADRVTGAMVLPKGGDAAVLRAYFSEVPGKDGVKHLVYTGRTLEVAEVTSDGPDGLRIQSLATIEGKDSFVEPPLPIPPTPPPPPVVPPTPAPPAPEEPYYVMPPLPGDWRNDLGPQRRPEQPRPTQPPPPPEDPERPQDTPPPVPPVPREPPIDPNEPPHVLTPEVLPPAPRPQLPARQPGPIVDVPSSGAGQIVRVPRTGPLVRQSREELSLAPRPQPPAQQPDSIVHVPGSGAGQIVRVPRTGPLVRQSPGGQLVPAGTLTFHDIEGKLEMPDNVPQLVDETVLPLASEPQFLPLFEDVLVADLAPNFHDANLDYSALTELMSRHLDDFPTREEKQRFLAVQILTLWAIRDGQNPASYLHNAPQILRARMCAHIMLVLAGHATADRDSILTSLEQHHARGWYERQDADGKRRYEERLDAEESRATDGEAPDPNPVLERAPERGADET